MGERQLPLPATLRRGTRRLLQFLWFGAYDDAKGFTRCAKESVLGAARLPCMQSTGALNSGAIELLVTARRRGWLTAYVCVSCGYSELDLEDAALQSIVADQWPIVASEIQ
jgi:hypothetical protein